MACRCQVTQRTLSSRTHARIPCCSAHTHTMQNSVRVLTGTARSQQGLLKQQDARLAQQNAARACTPRQTALRITGQGWNGTGSGSGQPRLESVHADLKNDRLQQQSGSSLSILTLEQRILSSRCRSSVLLPSAERLQPSTTLTTAQMAGCPVEYTVSFDECYPFHTIDIHDSKP